jgi:methionine-rich copper-binding protein CopC
MRSTTARRWSGRTAFGVVIVAAALGLSAGPASAHTTVDSSSPAEGSTVTEQPGVFALTVNDPLIDLHGVGSSSVMEISGPADAAKPLYYGDGCVKILDKIADTEAQLGQPGAYTVAWRVVADDGHPVSGRYSFTWQPAAGQKLAAGSPEVPTCGGSAQTAQQTDTAGSGTAAPVALSDVAWIAGALGAVLLAVVATLLVVTRRKPRAVPADLPADSTPPE